VVETDVEERDYLIDVTTGDGVTSSRCSAARWRHGR
jgi:hypothetical protein